MDKNRKYMLVGALLTGGGVSLMAYTASRYTSFKRIVANTIRLEEIASLEISRLSSVPGEKKDIIITDPAVIERIFTDFSHVQLMKSARNVSSDKNFSYYITIVQADRKQRFDIILKSRQHMIIYDNDLSNPHLNAYKIISPYNPQALEQVFD
ncbi:MULTISPECIES: hypothetical protein [Paenibacillus]|uniref:Uncharacterized protein n=1 Tax=Paenibacillus odorifer TaxID=189426 RepID=A0A1R0XCI8_9BACL|nr:MULTISPECIES: hypothetical protein [Paenibacillus]ETT49596.1 hypothetical protein C171_25035 [Paenibacillus sp. FSL H8-237]OMD32796.1 hypothetical protein BJP51_14850 [Paenibacillus odorifer]OME33998.1 hypothetical protein BSK63_09320 [Paenibacillus odorifer]OME38956.1 hypothetical protein BSK46_12390 [Paenibacillus odorifer]OME40488.1 hypothetical protein BSK58_16275 [Paenibacillus odorifer]